MITRDRFLVALLWLIVPAQATWVGGTLYQMLVIVPMWSASPPESVQAFFGGTDYNRTIFNFFGPRFMIARSLPLVLALLVGWHRPKHRYALRPRSFDCPYRARSFFSTTQGVALG